MRDQDYYNLVAAVAALSVIGFGMGALSSAPSSVDPSPGSPNVSYLNLSITLNATTGWPQYSPANFSVPIGTVLVTIVDQDMPMAWTGCSCNISGTVGNVESINGTTVSVANDSNIAHTFTVGALGINVLSPGQSTVAFTLDLATPGTYEWFCIAPCGAGTDPYNTPPMGTVGYMTGTMTVY
jgi:hypothetical protein